MKHLRIFDSVEAMNTAIANSTIGMIGLAYNGSTPVMKKKDTPPAETRVVCTYNVTSTSNPINVYFYNQEEISQDYPEYYNPFTAMEVDGINVSLSTQYQFNTTGTHTIKFTLANNAELGIFAFNNCSSLTSVTIPNTVTTIGTNAFNGCSNLTSVNMGTSIITVGEAAFIECSNLTSVTIPNSVTTISGYAFMRCSNLTSVTIPNSVTSIGEYAFNECSNLTSVTIPNTITIINESTFNACSSLTSVTIPNSVTTIGDWAFSECSSLSSVTMYNNLISIGQESFYGCDLIEITVPNTVTSIGENAFNGIINVIYNGSETEDSPWGAKILNGYIEGDFAYINNTKTNLAVYFGNGGAVTIPNTVTTIGYNAFFSCTGLTSVTIPNSVTTISNAAFGACTGLTSVTIPDSVTTIGPLAFNGCSGLSSITCNATTPPTLTNSTTFNYTNNCPIYVPAASVDTYKSTQYWSTYESRIQAIQS